MCPKYLCVAQNLTAPIKYRGEGVWGVGSLNSFLSSSRTPLISSYDRWVTGRSRTEGSLLRLRGAPPPVYYRSTPAPIHKKRLTSLADRPVQNYVRRTDGGRGLRGEERRKRGWGVSLMTSKLFGINANERTTAAAQDEGRWSMTAEQGAEHFMAKRTAAAENAGAGRRHAVEYSGVMERTKERLAHSKPTCASSPARVNNCPGPLIFSSFLWL